MAKRQTFSSHTLTVLTMIGVAVGLGNVWRFPYMMGKFGGSAFLFVFLFFVVLFAIPAVMGEWALGRITRQGPLGAFSQALGTRSGKVIGLMLMTTVFVASSYYLLVIAYIVYTTIFSAIYGFAPSSQTAYREGLDSGWLQYGVALLLLGLSCWVILRGLRRGIEKVSLMFLPYFGVIILILIVYALSLEGAFEQFRAFLKPDLNAMLEPGNIFAAMGQAFFSLSLGGTFFVIYGSYLRADENIPISALWTGLGDAGAAVLASLFIVPTILVFGLELDQGPSLIFETLPKLFGAMAPGRILGSLFLLGLTLIAFLSIVAALQVLVGGLVDRFGMARRTAVWVTGLVEVALLLPVALHPALIGRLDLIFGSAMQCLGSALALIALTFGLGKQRALKEIFGTTGGLPKKLFFFWLQWIIPLGLMVTLAMYILGE